MPILDAIFFDVDGTLVDARKDIVNAVNYFLRELKLPPKPFEEIVSFIGTGVRDLVVRSVGKRGSNPAVIDKGVELFSSYYMKHPADEARLYPHAKDVLEHFAGKRKFILTNRYSRFAVITLDKMGIGRYFEAIVGGDDDKCLKPSACVLDAFLPQKGIDKEKTIIVGDMAIDIMTGKNSGIKTCWVSHGLGKLEDVRGLNPDFMINDLLELKSIVK